MAYFPTVGAAIGIADVSAVYTAGNPGYPWTSPSGVLPAVTVEQMFGQIIQAQNSDPTVGGGGEFIFLRVPTSTTVTAGLLYGWGDATSGYDVVALPTSSGTTTTSGIPVAVAVNSVTSNASSAQATWFQVEGRCTVLKDAVKMAPGAPVYFSKAAAGRVRVIGSAFYAVLGMRSATASTITTTTSSALMYVNRPCLAAAI